MKRLGGVFALACMAALTGAALAQNGNDQSSAPSPQSGQQPAMQQGQQQRGMSPKGEERITREVYHRLVMLPQLTIFDHLSYKVNGEAVTLMGEVRDPVLKSEAQNAVQGIEGVEQVDNQIKVLPLSTMDDQLRIAVARAVFNDPRLFPYSMQSVPPIHIIVENGHVKLEGVVNNEGDKNTAEIRAKTVPGVFSVENDLQVENQGKK